MSSPSTPPPHNNPAPSHHPPRTDSALAEVEQILSELELVEARLRRMDESMTRTQRLATMGTMSSIIAHEFNNILTPIISYCQLAKQANDGDPLIRKALEKSLIGAERAAKISASMLGFARDDNDETQADLHAIINESISCMARDPAKDGIDLTIQVEPNTWVEMEPVSLQQVIVNLTLNAKQAMRARGGKLKFSAKPASPTGDFTEIYIEDTGPGIPPNVLPNIFDPFVTQRETDPDTGSKGTGLGLAVCRDLIQRVGGKIDIPRTDQTGTTFRIQLLTADQPASDTLC